MRQREALEFELEKVKKFSVFEVFCALRVEVMAEVKEKKIPNMCNEDFYLLAEKKFVALYGGRAYGGSGSFYRVLGRG